MKILYFHQHFSTPQGAVGIRSYQMATALTDRGHEVTIVCGSYDAGNTGLSDPYVNGRRMGSYRGISVVEFELPYSNNDGFLKRAWIFLKFAFKSVNFALREPAHIVFATSTPLTAALPGIVASLLTRKKFIFEVRDLWPELPRAMGVVRNPIILMLMSVLEWLAYRYSSICIGLSPGIVEGIRKRSPDNRHIEMIPNGSNLDLFDPLAVNGWRPEEVGADDLMAVFAGTHGLANGLDAVLDAAACLKERDIDDIKIVLIGDGRCKTDLQRRAEREGLKNCIFLDPVPKVRLAGLFKESDLGLMILADIPEFYYGTSPNKFFDYIAAGLPVLNNYPGWLAEMIVEYECGWAVPPGNSSSFADALIVARDDRSKRTQFGVNARTLAEKEFGWKKLENAFVDTIESVAEK